MKRIFATGGMLAVLLASAPARSADDLGFKGPGWYLLVNAFVLVIDSGPYDSKTACLAQESVERDRTGDTSDNGYECDYLQSESDVERINGGN